MTIKRKSDENIDHKVSRKRRKLNHEEPSQDLDEIVENNHESDDHSPPTAACLPDEILLLIFSFLSMADLQYSVIPVCTKWEAVATSSSLWHTIKVGPVIPKHILLTWLDTAAHKLLHFRLKGRNDAEEILRKV